MIINQVVVTMAVLAILHFSCKLSSEKMNKLGINKKRLLLVVLPGLMAEGFKAAFFMAPFIISFESTGRIGVLLGVVMATLARVMIIRAGEKIAVTLPKSIEDDPRMVRFKEFCEKRAKALVFLTTFVANLFNVSVAFLFYPSPVKLVVALVFSILTIGVAVAYMSGTILVFMFIAYFLIKGGK